MKRFSPRESLLLMLPVMVMGALGFWVSRRSTRQAAPLSLGFSLQKPTAPEVFRGADAVFEVKLQGRDAEDYRFQLAAPYLEIQTPRGIKRAYRDSIKSLSWAPHLWNNSTNDGSTFRFLLHTAGVPAGTMHFVFNGTAATSGFDTPARPTPVRLMGQWNVNRALLKPPVLLKQQHNPLVSLRDIKITLVTRRSISGEAVFHLDGVAMNSHSPLSMELKSSRGGGMGMFSGASGLTPQTDRRRVTGWTVYADSRPGDYRVSGRVSADNRWPLGFQIEPFNFRTVTVGQKLKFKQFPVPLPK